ncbi:MAG: helix-turn-helix transcriptional regulator [Clostridiales bacterium]|jgi:DNA (cytosine-5)-methyltransferase 1|nr:helix-turn-helix transcriptional regulator [Clostridiales bacterium]
MAICYNGLWKLLIDKGVKRTELRALAGVSTNAIAKLGKNEPVALETLAKICTALKCNIADVVEMKGDDNEGE